MHEVDLPASETPSSSPATPLSAPSTTPQHPSSSSAASSTPVEAGPATAELHSVGGWELSTPPSTESAPRTALFPPEQSGESEPLDDEAFFASLREAVSDQAPLGPRDEPPAQPSSYDEDEERSGLFRRRR
jgi:hypothetical protein